MRRTDRCRGNVDLMRGTVDDPHHEDRNCDQAGEEDGALAHGWGASYTLASFQSHPDTGRAAYASLGVRIFIRERGLGSGLWAKQPSRLRRAPPPSARAGKSVAATLPRPRDRHALATTGVHSHTLCVTRCLAWATMTAVRSPGIEALRRGASRLSVVLLALCLSRMALAGEKPSISPATSEQSQRT